MLIHSLNLPDSSGILQLGGNHLLDSHDDAIGTSDCNGSTTAVDSFEGILDLEKLTIGREDRNSLVVTWHYL